MRNHYLYEQALKVGSVKALEDGINNLNSLLVNRKKGFDNFICNQSIWECDTTQGRIFELYHGIIDAELQRLVPHVFKSFTSHVAVYNDHTEMDVAFPDDCNAFVGFEFANTIIESNRRVHNNITYNTFVKRCLKYGQIRNETEMNENLSFLYPSFIFSERAVEETLNWKNSNPNLYDRLFTLFDDIPKNPFTGGIGETEVLRHLNGVASKRINQAHRLTYRLQNNSISILACSGHYN